MCIHSATGAELCNRFAACRRTMPHQEEKTGGTYSALSNFPALGSEDRPCYSDEPTEDDNLIAPQMTKIPMARAINQISKFIAP